MIYFRKNGKIPGSLKTKRLRKKQQKYLDFVIAMSCLYGATMKGPFISWSQENKDLLRKYLKQYQKYTRWMLSKLR